MKLKPMTRKLLRIFSNTLSMVFIVLLIYFLIDIERISTSQEVIADSQQKLIERYEDQLCPNKKDCEILDNSMVAFIKMELESAQNRLGRTYFTDNAMHLVFGIIFLMMLSYTNNSLSKKYLGEEED